MPIIRRYVLVTNDSMLAYYEGEWGQYLASASR